MIGYIKGQILEHNEGKVIVAIGVIGGESTLGYLLSVPQSPAYSALLPGKMIELFVHTHVREDALDLYGFSTRGEKELYLTLLTVNGIGPKGALGILSKVDPGLLIQAILDQDKDSLLRIPGIGKKTAERVVIELSDTIKKKVEAGVFFDSRATVATADNSIMKAPAKVSGAQAMLRDAKEALIGLGYREQEIGLLLKRVLDEQTAPPKKVEDLIRAALQQLSQ